MVLDAQKNLAEMQLRALCKMVAIVSVDTYLSSGKTDLTVDLKLLVPHYQRSSEDTWKKGNDLIDETLAEFGFQTKSINLREYISSNSTVGELTVTIEGLKE